MGLRASLFEDWGKLGPQEAQAEIFAYLEVMSARASGIMLTHVSRYTPALLSNHPARALSFQHGRQGRGWGHSGNGLSPLQETISFPP